MMMTMTMIMACYSHGGHENDDDNDDDRTVIIGTVTGELLMAVMIVFPPTLVNTLHPLCVSYHYQAGVGRTGTKRVLLLNVLRIGREEFCAVDVFIPDLRN